MKLIARTTINHDGKSYAEGESLDVKDKKQAQALIDCGAAEEEGKAKPSDADKPGDDAKA
jgi:hypothetical protein